MLDHRQQCFQPATASSFTLRPQSRSPGLGSKFLEFCYATFDVKILHPVFTHAHARPDYICTTFCSCFGNATHFLGADQVRFINYWEHCGNRVSHVFGYIYIARSPPPTCRVSVGNSPHCATCVPLNLRCLHFLNVFHVCWLLRCDACFASYPAELHFWHWHRLRSGWNE